MKRLKESVTVDELRESIDDILDELKQTRTPVAVRRNGEIEAMIVPADHTIILDQTITPEEAEEISRGLAISEADIAAGRVVTLEEARERLRKIWEARGETL